MLKFRAHVAFEPGKVAIAVREKGAGPRIVNLRGPAPKEPWAFNDRAGKPERNPLECVRLFKLFGYASALITPAALFLS